MPKCKAKFITSIKIADSTGNLFCNLFDKQANEIFGITADEIKQYRESGQEHLVADLLKEC